VPHDDRSPSAQGVEPQYDVSCWGGSSASPRSASRAALPSYGRRREAALAAFLGGDCDEDAPRETMGLLFPVPSMAVRQRSSSGDSHSRGASAPRSAEPDGRETGPVGRADGAAPKRSARR